MLGGAEAMMNEDELQTVVAQIWLEAVVSGKKVLIVTRSFERIFYIFKRIYKLHSWNEEDSWDIKKIQNVNFTILVSFFVLPEVARTRLRQEGDKYRSFWQTIFLVFREEGHRGLYRGLGTQLVRQIPNTAIMMATYEAVVYLLGSSSSGLATGGSHSSHDDSDAECCYTDEDPHSHGDWKLIERIAWKWKNWCFMTTIKMSGRC